jgi:hypothetical protein
LEKEADNKETTIIDTASGWDKERSVEKDGNIYVAQPGFRPSPGQDEDYDRRDCTTDHGVCLRMEY